MSFSALKRLCLAVLAAGILAAPATARPEFRDDDWNLTFYANCDLPVPEGMARAPSVAWVGPGDPALRFRLAAGDVGGCSSDPVERGGVPFWERAEIRQDGELSQGLRHDIRFTATIVDGFTGSQETFFQLHGWQPDCTGPPLMMLQFHNRGLRLRVLKPRNEGPLEADRGRLEEHHVPLRLWRASRIGAMRGVPLQYQVLADFAAAQPTVSIRIAGEIVAANIPVHLRRCNEAHIKLGLYRPGSLNRHTSVVEFDDVSVISGR